MDRLAPPSRLALALLGAVLLAGCGDDPAEEDGSTTPDWFDAEPGTTKPDAADPDAGVAYVDPWDESEREVPEIPPEWRAVGVTEDLLTPWLAREQAPETFRLRFDTTVGDITVECVRAWAPNGVDRLWNLVQVGYYTNIAFHRVIEGEIAQFGIHGNPLIGKTWQQATIADDPVVQSNRRGYLSFAKQRIPHSRTVQLFFNLRDNEPYDERGFAPVGRVVDGLSLLDEIHPELYVKQTWAWEQGSFYLKPNFPHLDYVRSVEVVE